MWPPPIVGLPSELQDADCVLIDDDAASGCSWCAGRSCAAGGGGTRGSLRPVGKVLTRRMIRMQNQLLSLINCRNSYTVTGVAPVTCVSGLRVRWTVVHRSRFCTLQVLSCNRRTKMFMDVVHSQHTILCGCVRLCNRTVPQQKVVIW